MENICSCSVKHFVKALILLPVFSFALVPSEAGGAEAAAVANVLSVQAWRDSTAGPVVPLKWVDVRPGFPGGRGAMAKYVDDFFRNDSAGSRALSFLSVKVRFVVEEDGTISNCRIVDGVTPDVDAKVLAMLSAMPRWTPGYKDGKVVRTGYGTRIKVPDYSGDVKTQPEFVGGRKGLIDYLKSELAKHDIAKDYEGRPVRLLTEFVVRADGSVSDAKVIRHGTTEMDSVVLAVINGMPRWTPGTLNGTPVNVEYKLPVTFGSVRGDGVRVNPEFPGGKEVLDKYVKANLCYPELSDDVRRSGKVVVRFVVDKDGSIVEPEIVKHGTDDMDEEVLRFLSEMPRWNPGTLDGKPVRVRQTVTIDFDARETAFTKYDDNKKRHPGRRADGGRPKRMVYVIDGKEVEKHVFDKIDARKIKSIEPMRPREARRLYGEKAADGAIVVTTTDPEY